MENGKVIQLKNTNNEEDVKMKTWSLKKKLLVGGGLISGIVVGILAYGKNHGEESQTDGYFEDEDEDYDDSDELDDEKEESEVEVETQE